MAACCRLLQITISSDGSIGTTAQYHVDGYRCHPLHFVEKQNLRIMLFFPLANVAMHQYMHYRFYGLLVPAFLLPSQLHVFWDIFALISKDTDLHIKPRMYQTSTSGRTNFRDLWYRESESFDIGEV